MVCISETFSNRFNSGYAVRVTIRTVPERGPEWERKNDKDVCNTYFQNLDEARRWGRRNGMRI